MPKSWQPGDPLWARNHPGSMPCPYCGELTLIVSMMDIVGDDLRVELYCSSDLCEARSFAIVLMSHYGMARADTQALHAVDQGNDPAEEDILSPASVARFANREDVVLERRRQSSDIIVKSRARR